MDDVSVLLVEDSGFISEQLSQSLPMHGIQVENARTASAARDKLSSTDFDCILVNHDLPDISGLTFAETVDSDTAIILLTSTPLDEIASDATAAGITEFFQKDNLNTESMFILANRIEVSVRATQ